MVKLSLMLSSQVDGNVFSFFLATNRNHGRNWQFNGYVFWDYLNIYIYYIVCNGTYTPVVVADADVDIVVIVNIIRVIKHKIEQCGDRIKSYGDYKHLSKVTLAMKVQFCCSQTSVAVLSGYNLYIYIILYKQQRCFQFVARFFQSPFYFRELPTAADA